MTDIECLKALFRKEEAERVIYLEYNSRAVAAIQAGKTLLDANMDPGFSYDSQKQLARDIGWIFQPAYPSIGFDFGGTVQMPEDKYAQASEIMRYPVENEDEAWQLKLPDMGSLLSVQRAMKFCRISSGEKLDNQYFNVIFSSAGPFTMAGNMCGLDRLARWLVKKPEIIHHMLRLAADHIIQAATLWMDTFKDSNPLFLQGEPVSSNQVISPVFFKNFALPYIKEINETVLRIGYKHIFYHICGDHNANLPFWAQVPMGDPGIVSFGQEVDLEYAAEYFPRDIIYGNLNPVLLQTEKPDNVYEATKQVILKGKNIRNRYIFGRACEIPTRAKKENLKAVMKAVNDFGWYE